MKNTLKTHCVGVATSAVASWSGLRTRAAASNVDPTGVRVAADPVICLTAVDVATVRAMATGVAATTAKRLTLLVPSRAPSPPV